MINGSNNPFSCSPAIVTSGSNLYVGTYVDLTALTTAHPSPVNGSRAIIVTASGSDQIAHWDEGDSVWFVQGVGGVSAKKQFAYAITGFHRLYFPANTNLMKYNANYGMYTPSSAVDSGTTDATSLITTNTNQHFFIAPVDLKLIQNTSKATSTSFGGFDLKQIVSYYEQTNVASPSPYYSSINPTVVHDKDYSPHQSNALHINMIEDVISAVVIPKGALVCVHYAHLRTTAAYIYINTGLIFEEA